MTKKKTPTPNPFPEYAKVLYRGVRAGISAGLTTAGVTAGLLGLDITKPDMITKILVLALVISFGTGFLTAFGKVLRTYLDKVFGYNEKSLVARFMPV